MYLEQVLNIIIYKFNLNVFLFFKMVKKIIENFIISFVNIFSFKIINKKNLKFNNFQ